MLNMSFCVMKKLLFCSDYYGQPFKYRLHFMQRLCEKAGVKPFGFHAIRHLSASLMYDMGELTSSIQYTLRHQSAKTTDLYLRSLGTKTARSSLENLGRRMESGLAQMEEPPTTEVEGGS
jgi:integrase